MFYKSEKGLTDDSLKQALEESLKGKNPHKVLILPPDYTRMYSGAGKITAQYYGMLSEKCEVDVMPALGTHVPMTKEECEAFFCGVVPYEKLIVHNWRTDVVKIGEVPAEFVSDVSEGLVKDKIDVEVNRRIVSGEYDLIISVGQVVPHEVVGMANYSKNIFVGCGGSSMINSSHMLGAFYGLERIMGKDFSPRKARVRLCGRAFSRRCAAHVRPHLHNKHGRQDEHPRTVHRKKPRKLRDGSGAEPKDKPHPHGQTDKKSRCIS